MSSSVNKIVIAIDSFKGSLTSADAAACVEAGIGSVMTADVQSFPLADGGEGTVDALTFGMGGDVIELPVTGPLGETIVAKYGIVYDTTDLQKKAPIAVMEMASAAGIVHVPCSQRNPLKTTTFGVGMMINDAIARGCRKFIIGIGGSATNDGGVGMLQALGFDFLDEKGEQIPLGAYGLSKLSAIRDDNVIKELKQCNFLVACDVNNPLCGDNGCSRIFGPQKGATDSMINDMDNWLYRYASLVQQAATSSLADAPGAGAAGGLGFAFLSFTNAKLMPGVEIVLDAIGIENAIKDADIVVTGEGRLDGQSVMGKAPIGVAKLAKKYNKPVIAFCGCVGEGVEVCNEEGIDAYFPIIQKVTSLEDAMDINTAKLNLTNTTKQAFRLLTMNLNR